MVEGGRVDCNNVTVPPTLLSLLDVKPVQPLSISVYKFVFNQCVNWVQQNCDKEPPIPEVIYSSYHSKMAIFYHSGMICFYSYFVLEQRVELEIYVLQTY